ncbi:hypothetical protein HOY82DRAFT_401059 [Tuber indicum]|nr:hypothetical protein HOY82DRAFT_401059 [Tuber indicum]
MALHTTNHASRFGCEVTATSFFRRTTSREGFPSRLTVVGDRVSVGKTFSFAEFVDGGETEAQICRRGEKPGCAMFKISSGETGDTSLSFFFFLSFLPCRDVLCVGVQPPDRSTAKNAGQSVSLEWNDVTLRYLRETMHIRLTASERAIFFTVPVPVLVRPALGQLSEVSCGRFVSRMGKGGVGVEDNRKNKNRGLLGVGFHFY